MRKRLIIVIVSALALILGLSGWAMAATSGNGSLAMAGHAKKHARSGSVLLGNTNLQSVADTNSGSEAFGYVASTSGTATSISVYLTSNDGVEVAIYADNNNRPGALLDHSSVRSNHKKWMTIQLSGSVNITSGTHYWLAVGAVNGGSVTYFDSGSNGSNLDYSGSGFANPFDATGQSNSDPASIYLSGIPSSATTTTTTSTSSTTTTVSSTTTTSTVASTTTTTTPSTTTTTTSGSGTPTNCTSGAQGVLGPYSDSNITMSNGYNTYVENNMWAAQSGTVQTTCANSPGDWTVSSKTTQDQGGAVQTAPMVQQQLDDWTGTTWGPCATTASGGSTCSDTPISALSSLDASFSMTNPPTSNGTWEGMIDTWWNNNPNSEIMIWLNYSNSRVNGYGGAQVIQQNVMIDGQSYTYVNYGGGLPQMVLNTPETSGTISLLDVFKWLESQGIISSTATLAIVDFGWEICSTGSQTLNFAVGKFSLTGS